MKYSTKILDMGILLEGGGGQRLPQGKGLYSQS